jgi:peroxiredoxin Q/BCP
MRVMATIALAGLLLLGSAVAGEEAGTKAVLDVGAEAPAFTMAGSDGKTYSLSDFAGEQAVVIAWFPKAFTSG